MVSRILVPVDLTPVGEAKLPVAQEYARAFDAEVLLLHILPARAMDTDVILPSEAAARAYLDVLVAGHELGRRPGRCADPDRPDRRPASSTRR